MIFFKNYLVTFIILNVAVANCLSASTSVESLLKVKRDICQDMVTKFTEYDGSLWDYFIILNGFTLTNVSMDLHHDKSLIKSCITLPKGTERDEKNKLSFVLPNGVKIMFNTLTSENEGILTVNKNQYIIKLAVELSDEMIILPDVENETLRKRKDRRERKETILQRAKEPIEEKEEKRTFFHIYGPKAYGPKAYGPKEAKKSEETKEEKERAKALKLDQEAKEAIEYAIQMEQKDDGNKFKKAKDNALQMEKKAIEFRVYIIQDEEANALKEKQAKQESIYLTVKAILQKETVIALQKEKEQKEADANALKEEKEADANALKVYGPKAFGLDGTYEFKKFKNNLMKIFDTDAKETIQKAKEFKNNLMKRLGIPEVDAIIKVRDDYTKFLIKTYFKKSGFLNDSVKLYCEEKITKEEENFITS